MFRIRARLTGAPAIDRAAMSKLFTTRGLEIEAGRIRILDQPLSVLAFDLLCHVAGRADASDMES